jgi:transcriptional regulator with XRE-family HTH domain
MILLSNINKWYAMSDSAIVTEIGGLIRRIRLQKNITQQQLADNVGLYRSTISEIENGRASSLVSFIVVLRGLEKLEMFDFLSDVPAISPLKLARKEKQSRKRASVIKRQNNQPQDPEILTW